MKIGILSDIHEDIVSLKKAVNVLEKRGCDYLVCLGDIVGFESKYYFHGPTRNASECLRVVRENCRFVLAGNHDLNAAERLPKDQNVFNFPPDWYSLSQENREKVAAGKIWTYAGDEPGNLTTDDKNYLMSLPEYYILSEGDTRILFSHSVFPDVPGMSTHLPTRRKDFINHLEWVSLKKCTLSFCGHLHPNGLVGVSERNLSSYGFQDIPLPQKLKTFICPCNAESNCKKGVIIIDTILKTISCISV